MAEQDIRLNVITLDFGNELGEDESDEEKDPANALLGAQNPRANNGGIPETPTQTQNK